MAVLPKDHLNHILMYGSITKGSSLSYPYVWQYYQRIILITSLCMAVLPKDHYPSLCMAVLPKDHLNLMYGSITKGSS